jgi:hypothetical protein
LEVISQANRDGELKVAKQTLELGLDFLGPKQKPLN